MPQFRHNTAGRVKIGPVFNLDGSIKTDAVIGNFNVSKNGANSAALASPCAVTYDSTNDNGEYYLDYDAAMVDTPGHVAIDIDGSAPSMGLRYFDVLLAPVWDMFYANNPGATGGFGVVDANGNIAADTKRLGGTTVTGRDIGASVLLSVGTGTGQVNLSSGKVPATIANGDNSDKTGYALTTVDKDDIASRVDAAFVNEADGVNILQALADKIASDWVAGDVSVVAVVTAIVNNASIAQLIADAAAAKVAAQAAPSASAIVSAMDSDSTKLAAAATEANATNNRNTITAAISSSQSAVIAAVPTAAAIDTQVKGTGPRSLKAAIALATDCEHVSPTVVKATAADATEYLYDRVPDNTLQPTGALTPQ